MQQGYYKTSFYSDQHSDLSCLASRTPAVQRKRVSSTKGSVTQKRTEPKVQSIVISGERSKKQGRLCFILFTAIVIENVWEN